MEKKYDGFSMQEAMRLAQSDAGQQLLQLLRSNHSDAARSALEKAQEAGNAKAVNVVLIGMLSMMLEIPEELWLSALEKTVKPQHLELNKRAFALGRELAK